MFGKIVGIPIEEALLLDEVEEHEAIEQERRIFFAFSLCRDAENSISENATFSFKAVIKAPDDLVFERLEVALCPLLIRCHERMSSCLSKFLPGDLLSLLLTVFL